METIANGLEFDPGFAPYILAFRGSVEYIYADINKFKNFSQRKLKFKQYYKKLIEIFYNNMGFYTGCLMWASYIKTQPKQKILSNPCFGQSYDEKENIDETQFMQKFVELLPKDIKYYASEQFSFDDNILKLIKTYEEFLVLNKGFVESEYNTEIALPNNLKVDNAITYKEKIDEVLKSGDLSKLLDYLPEII